MCQEWNMQSQQNSWEKFSVRGALSDFRSESPTAQQLGLLTAPAPPHQWLQPGNLMAIATL